MPSFFTGPDEDYTQEAASVSRELKHLIQPVLNRYPNVPYRELRMIAEDAAQSAAHAVWYARWQARRAAARRAGQNLWPDMPDRLEQNPVQEQNPAQDAVDVQDD